MRRRFPEKAPLVFRVVLRTTSHSERSPAAASGSSKFARLASVPMNGMNYKRHASYPARRHASGVTLVEILVVMGIVATLMAIGIPSYKYVTNANRISAEINGLLGDLQFARSEAIKEGRTVSVCVSSDQSTCLTTTPDTNWQKGWIVFSDVNGDGNIDTANGDLLLRAQTTFKGTDTFSANNTI